MVDPKEQNTPLWTRNFALICVSSFAFFLSFYYLLPTLPTYVRMWGGKSEQIGLIIGIFALSSLVLRPFLGHLVDTTGRKWMIILGTIIFLVSSSLYYFAHTLFALLAVRVLHGAGMAVYNTSATTYAADCAPPGRRGEAMGVHGAFMNLAMAVGPAVGGIVVAAVKDPSLGPIPAYTSAYANLFLLSALTALFSVIISIPLKDVLPSNQKVGVGGMVLFSREAVFPGLVMLTITATYGTLISFLPDLADSRNLGEPGVFFTIFAVVLILVRVAAGALSDRRGRGVVILPGTLFVAGAMVILAYSRAPMHMYLAAVVYAIGMAATQPALTALAVDRVGPERRGAAMGTFTAAFELGLGGGAILFGMLLSGTNFTITFLGTAAAAFIGFIIFTVVSLRNRITKKN